MGCGDGGEFGVGVLDAFGVDRNVIKRCFNRLNLVPSASIPQHRVAPSDVKQVRQLYEASTREEPIPGVDSESYTRDLSGGVTKRHPVDGVVTHADPSCEHDQADDWKKKEQSNESPDALSNRRSNVRCIRFQNRRQSIATHDNRRHPDEPHHRSVRGLRELGQPFLQISLLQAGWQTPSRALQQGPMKPVHPSDNLSADDRPYGYEQEPDHAHGNASFAIRRPEAGSLDTVRTFRAHWVPIPVSRYTRRLGRPSSVGLAVSQSLVTHSACSRRASSGYSVPL